MRKILIAIAALLALSVNPAFAAKQFAAYDKAKLETLIKSGATVVVHVHAEWCPVCRRQMSLLDELLVQPKFEKFQAVRVNYDVDRDFLAAHKVKRQANILVFKGGKDTRRFHDSSGS
jgi:thiol-disulfide isomerase/thioredoxin